MPVPESAKKAHRKWDELNHSRYWQCTVRFPASDRKAIVNRAADLGIPVSEYIRSLVHADLVRSSQENP